MQSGLLYDTSTRDLTAEEAVPASVLVVQANHVRPIIEQAALKETVTRIERTTGTDDAVAATDEGLFDVVFIDLCETVDLNAVLLRRLRSRGLAAPAVMAIRGGADSPMDEVLLLDALGVEAVLRAPYSVGAFEASIRNVGVPSENGGIGTVGEGHEEECGFVH